MGTSPIIHSFPAGNLSRHVEAMHQKSRGPKAESQEKEGHDEHHRGHKEKEDPHASPIGKQQL